ncbi:hypothetical protein I6F65_03030 [Pseudoalteromonas sp. SWXJZ94C]|uniref:hypothetical protein n=1 Tax=Pseudoalteromonas sp. SWXJZ94C TaxID=2792065 RepID=UPI0018CF8460|nr:hypothetical protein [Pseudoalteromonas sp. SWXJZ94C]MBH0055923.1 hypothetical protein [Pseudoalteromonas sp. SWXJZ94C]
MTAFYYTNNSCLLSDRGFCTPVNDDRVLSFDFNISSNLFLRYLFLDVDDFAPVGTPSNIIELYKNMSKQISYDYEIDDLGTLSKYNRDVIYQCHNKFFNSTTTIYGL